MKQCTICGTRVAPGQPHTALEPVPHQSLAALIVEEVLTETPFTAMRELDHTTGQS